MKTTIIIIEKRKSFLRELIEAAEEGIILGLYDGIKSVIKSRKKQ